MNSPLQSAHNALYAALNSMLAGEKQPIFDVWSESDDVSYGGPFGGIMVGRAEIEKEFERSAAMRLAGRIEVTDVHFIESGDMGVSFCVEHGIDHVIEGNLVNLKHRATNVFRREADGWRLVHHHTDLAE